jgi:hypothetical protein
MTFSLGQGSGEIEKLIKSSYIYAALCVRQVQKINIKTFLAIIAVQTVL